ncbi:MAG TPA: endonuclease domain-containing protein [Candidatus Binataceae bacterium]|nr:endonuclease domain-containing protein [Candidatus Binataceae bacterium]
MRDLVGNTLHSRAFMSKPPLMRDLARHLRREQTETELRLWMQLRAGRLGVKFRRQYPIGPYVADFCCVERQLIVELDGGQHAEPAQQGADQRRSAVLAASGYRVLRFWDSEVLTNIEGVLEEILRQL